MVTAILPSVTGGSSHIDVPTCNTIRKPLRHNRDTEQRHSTTPSLTSELTITPERYSRSISQSQEELENNGNSKDINSTVSPPKLAGLVGFFTGCGALVALILFLPLPAQFSKISGITQRQAIVDT